MKVLILYHETDREIRQTVHDHLYSFRKYLPENEFHYCNIFFKIPFYLKLVEYDSIILHYSLLSLRSNSPIVWRYLSKSLKYMKPMRSVKIALPQDDNTHTKDLWKLFKDCGITSVFTPANSSDYKILYPEEETGLKHYFTVFTGFVDEQLLPILSSLAAENPIRDIDLGYRARSLPFWLGKFGQIKSDIAQVFDPITTNLKIDISTKPEDVFFGLDWFRFILRCKTMLGCLGGASLFDPDAEIKKMVEAYTAANPNAKFNEVQQNCFEGKDNTLSFFCLSPRHFECAMAKTCQVLVEGDYAGVFKPGKHYIELKSDYSNVTEVLNQIKDEQLCKRIAETTYNDIVLSGKYTYKKFAEQIVSHIQQVRNNIQYENMFYNSQFWIIKNFLKFRKKIEFFHFLRFRIFRFRHYKFNKWFS